MAFWNKQKTNVPDQSEEEKRLYGFTERAFRSLHNENGHPHSLLVQLWSIERAVTQGHRNDRRGVRYEIVGIVQAGSVRFPCRVEKMDSPPKQPVNIKEGYEALRQITAAYAELSGESFNYLTGDMEERIRPVVNVWLAPHILRNVVKTHLRSQKGSGAFRLIPYNDWELKPRGIVEHWDWEYFRASVLEGTHHPYQWRIVAPKVITFESRQFEILKH